MGHHKCKKPDIQLRSDQGVQPSVETPQPLSLLLRKCKYILSTSVVATLKKCRQLKVEGSVSNGKVIITIEGETLRVFEFVNDSFTLIEDLKKEDKIIFMYQGAGTVVDIKAEIVKK